MNLYTCGACGCQRIGDHTLSTSRCPACGALAFGLVRKTYLPGACRVDKTGLTRLDDADIHAAQTVLLTT
jgi:DNA-directed RNA polymerase subunit RPC12/RpoP